MEISLLNVPLSALRQDSLLVLCTLNQEMILMSDTNRFRDWRGILALAPLEDSFKDSLKRTSEQKDYMRALINKWMEKKNNSSIAHLQKALKEIDRFDIYQDTLEHFEKDAKAYQVVSKPPVLQRTPTGTYVITTLDRQRVNNGQKMIIYDAFLMYAEKDEDFAESVKRILEQHGMHICIKNDFLGGIPFEHDAAMTLIAKRCRRVIIIVSKNFLNSYEDTFMSKYAQHIGIEHSSRKIVPCLKEECQIPSNLKILFHLKYYKDGRLFNFWMKLYEAVAYEASDSDLSTDEFDIIPHKEYVSVEIPRLLTKESLPFDNALNKDKEESSILKSEIKYLGPNPPTESPNNSTVKTTSKKKIKNPIKMFRVFSTKKHKVPELPIN